jgi:hypothetical protein
MALVTARSHPDARHQMPMVPWLRRTPAQQLPRDQVPATPPKVPMKMTARQALSQAQRLSTQPAAVAAVAPARMCGRTKL